MPFAWSWATSRAMRSSSLCGAGGVPSLARTLRAWEAMFARRSGVSVSRGVAASSNAAGDVAAEQSLKASGPRIADMDVNDVVVECTGKKRHRGEPADTQDTHGVDSS